MPRAPPDRQARPQRGGLTGYRDGPPRLTRARSRRSRSASTCRVASLMDRTDSLFQDHFLRIRIRALHLDECRATEFDLRESFENVPVALARIEGSQTLNQSSVDVDDHILSHGRSVDPLMHSVPTPSRPIRG